MPADLEARVQQAASLKGVTASEFVRQALERAIRWEFERRHKIASEIRQLSFESGAEPVARRAHEAFGELLDRHRAR